MILRKCRLVLAYLHLFVRQVAQEQGNSCHRIPPVVALRIDDSSVAFPSNQGADFVHLRGHINFSHCGGVVSA